MGKSSKQRISITIDPDLIEILKIKAEEDDRSLSQYINRELRKLLLKKEEGQKE
ncbi:MAG: toxin-antitoxin system protein [Stomatobaculum sp.]|nr:toxin-antitoxin system protein [Stomatobaculum sp.]